MTPGIDTAKSTGLGSMSHLPVGALGRTRATGAPSAWGSHLLCQGLSQLRSAQAVAQGCPGGAPVPAWGLGPPPSAHTAHGVTHGPDTGEGPQGARDSGDRERLRGSMGSPVPGVLPHLPRGPQSGIHPHPVMVHKDTCLQQAGLAAGSTMVQVRPGSPGQGRELPSGWMELPPWLVCYWAA